MTKNSRNLAMMLVGFAAIMSIGVLSAVNTVEASQEEVPGMMGHITLVVRDSDGNIKEYVQTDNAVTDTGRNCLQENNFGIADASCTAGAPFVFIGLGTATAAVGENVGNDLEAACVRSSAADASTGDEAISSGAGVETITLTVVFGGATSGAGGIANAACEATPGISEAGLFNNVGVGLGEMFAYQTFAAIEILTADTLTVTWSITLT